MSDQKCLCIESAWAVYADLRQAIDRIQQEITDEHVQKWMKGYRDGVRACEERLRLTQGKCCCKRVGHK